MIAANGFVRAFMLFEAAPRNCSELWGSADYSASCRRAAKHGTSIANRSRPLKTELVNGFVRAFMLFEAAPQGGAGARFQRVGAYSHDAWTVSRIGTDFACFTKEIDAPLRPTHATGALRQPARAAELALQLGQQLIKLRQVLRAAVVHWLHS